MLDLSKTFVVLLMLFLHVFDDFHLQGILADLKQKSWWEKNAKNRRYRFDYIVCLVMHSISWSFMIMLPIAVYYKFQVDLVFASFFVANVIVHAITDDMKANRNMINLIADQTIHIVQIAFTALEFLRFWG